MANQRLMKKVAPVVLSAAVAMTSMPATAFAADFSDTEVTVAEESADIEEASAEAVDTDVVEDTEDTDVDVEEAAEDVTADEETSDEELFSAEVSEDESADETGEGQTEGEAYVLMNIPYDDFYKAELKNNDVKVDAFTSATKQKTRSSLAKGSYHVNSDGSDITAINDFPLIPRYAVLDPKVTLSLPPFITATTGMDALTHAVEAYIGNSTTPGTRKNALDAVQLIFENLDRAYTNGSDKEARKNMLRASYFAGCAFTKSYVGYVHAVAHTLGGQYNVPHGLANAVLLPFVLESYGDTIHSKLARLALAAGVADSSTPEKEAAHAFIQAVKDMKKRFNIGDTIPEIKEEDIPKLAHYADKEGNPLYPVPVLMDAHELEKFYYILMDKKQEDTSNESE